MSCQRWKELSLVVPDCVWKWEEKSEDKKKKKRGQGRKRLNTSTMHFWCNVPVAFWHFLSNLTGDLRRFNALNHSAIALGEEMLKFMSWSRLWGWDTTLPLASGKISASTTSGPLCLRAQRVDVNFLGNRQSDVQRRRPFCKLGTHVHGFRK